MRTLIKDTIPIVHTDLFVNVKQQIKAGNNGTSIIVPHVCNNIDAFGAGFAGSVAEHYPIVKQNYHLLGLNFLKNNLGYVQFIDVDRDKSFGHRLIFANMISQNGIISKTFCFVNLIVSPTVFSIGITGKGRMNHAMVQSGIKKN